MGQADSSGAREAGLRRLVHAKRWIIGASVTLAGLLTAVFANAFPGKTVQSSAGSQGSSSSPSSPEQSPQGEAEQSAAQAPVQPSEAVQSNAEAPVVSGGS
jgi:hypothetical protein